MAPTRKTTKSGTSRSRRSGNGSKARSSGKTVSEVMTPEPKAMIESDTVLQAAETMREEDIGDVIVLDDTGGRLLGIVTDRDVVIRAVAEGLSPEETTLSTICSAELVTVSPDDPVDDAVRLMRDKAVRRLPVVEDGRAVGVVSLGDLAQALDRRSALADISSAPANA